MTTQTVTIERYKIELALEALGKAIRYGSFHGADWAFNEIEEAINVIKEALMSQSDGAQPEHSATHGGPVAVYGYCPECGAKGVIRERRLNGNDICASGHTYPSREAATLPQPKEPKQEPVKWIPIEQPYPQTKSIDILMGDGSSLCAVLPQFNGDLWWEGSGTGEKFIDPKYANVTHWRIHGETTTPYVATPRPQRKPWVSLSEEDREQHRDSWRSNIHDQEIKAIEAKLRELNEQPRQWVGLTDVDRQEVFESMPDMLDGFLKKWGWLHFSKAIEAKLKEKNT